MKNLFVALLALLALPAQAADCRIPGLPKIIGIDYHHARADLIVAGFLPVPVAHPIDAGPIFKDTDLLGYFEASDCSGSGYGGCWYTWRAKSGRAFTIYARETFGEVRSIDCHH